jgi:hypothetical protein
MSLDALEFIFIRRFLLHVLPHGFQIIRRYGFLANRVRAEKPLLCRELLSGQEGERPKKSHPRTRTIPWPVRWLCPICRLGFLRLVGAPELVPILDAS